MNKDYLTIRCLSRKIFRHEVLLLPAWHRQPYSLAEKNTIAAVKHLATYMKRELSYDFSPFSGNIQSMDYPTVLFLFTKRSDSYAPNSDQCMSMATGFAILSGHRLIRKDINNESPTRVLQTLDLSQPIKPFAFSHMNYTWWLDYVWLHPYYRNSGALSEFWDETEVKWGQHQPLRISGPVSKAMASFLKKRDLLERVGRW